MDKAKKLVACPQCGNTGGFTSAERILATADVNEFSIDDAGNVSPEYAGESEIHWDTQEQVEAGGIGIYHCNSCGFSFDSPVACSREQLRAIRRQWRTLQKVVA